MNRRNINEADPALTKFIENHLGFIKADITGFCAIENIDEVWLNGLIIFLANKQLLEKDLNHFFINIDKEKVFEIGLLDEFEELDREYHKNLSFLSLDRQNLLNYSEFLQNLVTKIMYDNQPASIKRNIDESLKSFRKYFSNFKIRMIIIAAKSNDRNYNIVEMSSHAENIVLLVILDNKIFFLILDSFKKLIEHLNNNKFEEKAQEFRTITLSCGCKLEKNDSIIKRCPKCLSSLYKHEVDLLMKNVRSISNKNDTYSTQCEEKNTFRKEAKKAPKRASSADNYKAGYKISFQRDRKFYAKSNIDENAKKNEEALKDQHRTRRLTYDVKDSKNKRSKALEPGERKNSNRDKNEPQPPLENQPFESFKDDEQTKLKTQSDAKCDIEKIINAIPKTTDTILKPRDWTKNSNKVTPISTKIMYEEASTKTQQRINYHEENFKDTQENTKNLAVKNSAQGHRSSFTQEQSSSISAKIAVSAKRPSPVNRNRLR